MIKLLPEGYRVLFVIALMVALSGVSVWTGWKVGTAQQIATCATEKKDLQDKIDKLQLEIADLEKDKATLKQGLADANHAADLLKAQSDAAALAQKAAEAQVAEIKKSSESRIRKLTAAKEASTGCSDLLARYWEMRS